MALAATLLVGCAVWLACDVARRFSVCYDEPKHLATALSTVAEGAFVGDDNAPSVVLYALPFLAAFPELPALPPANARGKRVGLFAVGAEILATEGVMPTIRRARWIAASFFALLLLATGLLAWRTLGPAAAVLAVGFTAFEPSLLAHAGLVSADLPLALAALLVLAAHRAFAAAPTRGRAAWLGLAMGGAMLAKATGAVFVIALLVVAVFDPRLRRDGVALRRLGLAALLAVALVMLATPSDPLAVLRAVELAAGYAEVQGDEYFLGTRGSGSPWFYPAVLALKYEPFAAVAVLLALVFGARAKASPIARPWLEPVLAAAFFAVIVATGYRQGIRFLLPIFPLLALTAARLATTGAPRALRFTAFALLAAHVGSGAIAARDPLAYWNPLARGGGDRWFVDSNHDWGQGLLALAEWRRRHADARLFTLLYSSVPPAAYADLALRHDDLLAGGQGLAAFDPAAENWLAISVTLLRTLPLTSPSQLQAIAAVLEDELPDAEPSPAIRLYRLTAERLARLRFE
jgi:4-amino-4-deoxy-L-arabinose transferase-like glycosyltransferase